MRELNPIGREDNSLLLVSADGEQFTVTVDETLLRTIKEHRVPDASGEQLSPRQIQDAIRSGETITQIAERSGSSLSLIERFAHPVLEELQHMIDLAKSVRVELPADRFNEVAKRPFGEVIEEKLRGGDAQEITWSAKRGENSVWEVSVSFRVNESEGSAVWTFDPRRYLLTPETSTAQNLSNPMATFDSPLGTLKKQQPLAVDHPETASNTVVTEDKLQAFRKRREQTEAIEVIEVTEVVEILDDIAEESPAPEPIPADLGEETQVEAPKEEAPAPKSRRAPMPSWDQIVRGTQTDDGEAF